MFDLDRYFAQIASRLNCCRGQLVSIETEGPHARKHPDGSSARSLNLDIEWATGQLLEVGDYWFVSKDEERREFSYQFMNGDSSLIFRLDTHGRILKHGDACHIHIPDRILEQGDPKLHGFELLSITVIDAWNLIQGYLRGTKFPWEL